VIVNPGQATSINTSPSLLSDAGARSGAMEQKWDVFAFLASAGPVNALKYYCSSGNIAYSFLTVKGIV
jgi:hypothetical protein